MIRTIGMFGSEQSIRELRPVFMDSGIDLAEHDFVTAEEVIEELSQEGVDVVLMIERMSFGVENGKYGLVTKIREADPTVRIAFCAGTPQKDHEFENWCYKYRVYDIFYPDKGGQFNIAEIASYIKKGRLLADANEDGAKQENANSQQGGGSGRERKNPFENLTNRLIVKNPFKRKPKGTPKVQTDALEMGYEEDQEPVGKDDFHEPMISDSRTPMGQKPPAAPQYQKPVEQEPIEPVPPVVQTAPPVSDKPPVPVPQIIIREVEKPVEVIRVVEKPVEVIKKVYVDRPVEVTRTHHSGTYILGIFNLSRGAGATRTAVDIAEHLAGSGYKAAVVALDGRSDLKYQKGKAEYLVPEEDNGDTLVHFLAGNGRHEFIILDFGNLFDLSPSGKLQSYNLTDNRGKIGEFMRCNLHIGMGFTAEWHVNKIKYFTEHDVFSERIKSGGCVFFYDGDVKKLSRRYPELQLYHREAVTPVELLNSSLFEQMEAKPHKRMGLW